LSNTNCLGINHNLKSPEISPHSNHGLSYLLFVILSCYFSLFTVKSAAHDFALNYSQLEETISLPSENLALAPSGVGISISWELSPNWQLRSHYQNWRDQKSPENTPAVEIDLTTWSTSLGFTADSWYISGTVNLSKDEILIRGRKSLINFQVEETKTSTISSLIGYNWLHGSWLYDIALGAQYTDWQVNNKRHSETLSIPIKQQTNSNSVSLSASLAVARFIHLKGDLGFLIGTLLSWSYAVSGEENFSLSEAQLEGIRLRSGQRNVSRNSTVSSRVTSGDENSGQLTFYISYDLSQRWSVDFDVATEIASDENNSSCSVGIGYAF